MPYTITQRESVNPHEWAIVVATCDLEDDSDRLVTTTVNLVRRSYGENAVMSDAEAMLADEIDSGLFDLQHLKAAIREGLPDPEKEGAKPKQLTNYRSQSAEMVAKAALAKAYSYQYPAAPQEGSGNPNQPILGFDGWGMLDDGGVSMSLALIQVKATDSDTSPPADSNKLAEECRRAPSDRSAICRALTTLARLMRGDPLQVSVIRMLEKMGRNEDIPILVSPAIVRGITTATPADLAPVMAMANDILPACLRAIVVSIGVCLEQFGHRVMSKAREAI